MRSVEKLLGLDFDTICFSHFPPMRSDPSEDPKAYSTIQCLTTVVVDATARRLADGNPAVPRACT